MAGTYQLVQGRTIKEAQGLLMHVGSKGEPVCSDHTEKLLLFKQQNDENVSEHKVYRDLLHMGLCICRLVRDYPSTAVSFYNGQCEQWKKVARSDEPQFFFYRWMFRCLCVIYLG